MTSVGNLVNASIGFPLVLSGLLSIKKNLAKVEATENKKQEEKKEKEVQLCQTEFLGFSYVTRVSEDYEKMKKDGKSIDLDQVLIVDCSHPKGQTVTHHKGQNTPEEIRGDTSTDSVLNMIAVAFASEAKGKEGDTAQERNKVKEQYQAMLNRKYVTCNHFDIDSITSVWSVIYKDRALKYDRLLRYVAKIGDFRDQPLGYQKELTEEENELVRKALKICCWLNTVERNLFYLPFDGDELEGSVQKFNYFLPIFENVLKDVDNFEKDWREEYDIVMKGIEILENEKLSKITKYPDIGMVVIETKDPLHYYSLFSFTDGFDFIVTVYDNQRYEIEYKYTSYVDLQSRGSLFRVDNSNLMKKLNDLENNSEFVWDSHRITDTGPIGRLDKQSDKLSKVERYAHPYQRRIHASSIQKDIFLKTTLSFYQHAYAYEINQTSMFQQKKWSWSQIWQLNRQINWQNWQG